MEHRTYPLRDGTLSALHFGNTSEPVRLVLLHANGFNAQSYRAILEPLGVHAVAFDMRGHGQSRTMPQPMSMTNWHIFRDDCVEFFDRHLPGLTDRPVVLAGHSFGAVSGILAAPLLKDRISGYAGFDPVSVPLLFRLTSAMPGGRSYMKKRVPIARNAGRRKSEFESPEAAFSRWHGRGAFKGMPDDVLRDYIAGGLYEREDGVWELACHPKWEQAIFVAQWHNLFKAACDLPDNSKLIYAGGRVPVSTNGTRRAVQKAQPNIDVQFDPKLGHLFPFIQTGLATQALKDVLSAA
ncbi:MAG: alpha/beta hydrolase [Litorimonas sp.]